VSLVPLGQMQTHPRLTALIALRLQEFIDLVTGILLIMALEIWTRKEAEIRYTQA